MGKRAQAKREATATAKPTVEAPPLRTSPNWPLLALSVLGILLSSYLTWTAFKGLSVKGCGVGSACDIVLNSPWATLLGVPTSFWGLSAYVLLAAIAFVKRADRHWQYAWIVSFSGILYSVYLTTVSMTVLHAACPYCLTSLALMTSIFVLVTWQRPDTLKDFSWSNWLLRTVPVPAAAILLLHLNYTGVLGPSPQAEDPLARALAEHLTQKGVRFYGAQWCPHCQAQKKMFGVAAKRLPYVECSPDGGPGTPLAPICKELDIKEYPTWIIDGKRYEGELNMKQLADATGFKAPTTQ